MAILSEYQDSKGCHECEKLEYKKTIKLCGLFEINLFLGQAIIRLFLLLNTNDRVFNIPGCINDNPLIFVASRPHNITNPFSVLQKIYFQDFKLIFRHFAILYFLK